MVRRALTLPPEPSESFFLWGPRQTGKTSLLREAYPSAVWVDLLRTDEVIKYASRPAFLREELLEAPAGTLVVIDEVQKVPGLLDEVHWLIENRGLVFALCGSSARKVRRGHANLLGGRAIRYELTGLVSAELGRDFDLVRAVNNGWLPRHYLTDQPARRLRSYLDDYLKEEVLAEGLVRNLPPFATFLRCAALADAELVNMATIARDCGVSAPTVRGYFEILVDTLLARWLPAYTRRPKRRLILAPKFYFFDVGLVNVLARRGRLEPGSELFGKAFESWVFHEISAYRAYRGLDFDWSYWRLASGLEVDFVADDLCCAIEAKASSRVHGDHLRGLRELRVDQAELGLGVVVSLEARARRTEDGIRILPAAQFARELWSGALIPT